MPSNHLILCCPLLPPSIFPSIRVFSSESVICIRWPNYWSISFNISPSNEYSGLISFRMDWLDLLAVQETRKSLQHHSSKASILWCLAFFVDFHIHTLLNFSLSKRKLLYKVIILQLLFLNEDGKLRWLSLKLYFVLLLKPFLVCTSTSERLLMHFTYYLNSGGKNNQ